MWVRYGYRRLGANRSQTVAPPQKKVFIERDPARIHAVVTKENVSDDCVRYMSRFALSWEVMHGQPGIIVDFKYARGLFT